MERRVIHGENSRFTVQVGKSWRKSHSHAEALTEVQGNIFATFDVIFALLLFPQKITYVIDIIISCKWNGDISFWKIWDWSLLYVGRPCWCWCYFCNDFICFTEKTLPYNSSLTLTLKTDWWWICMLSFLVILCQKIIIFLNARTKK